MSLQAYGRLLTSGVERARPVWGEVTGSGGEVVAVVKRACRARSHSGDNICVCTFS